jgi:molecular chaperone GrpE
MTDIKQTLEQQSPGDGHTEPTPASPQPPGADAPGGAAAPADAARSFGEAFAETTAETTREDEAAEVEQDLGALVAKAAQRDEYLALAQRTQADFENFRKRVARDAASAQERGVATLAKELLPALDNLDRAIGAAAADDPLLQGVRLVRQELGAALARCGIESFCSVGEAFDPNLHEAVATAPALDGAPSGSVVEVYQAGYRLGDSVIRPARVVVAA